MFSLIADSGSTKTDWILHDTSSPHAPLITRFATSGLNPCLMSDADIMAVLQQEVQPAVAGKTGEDFGVAHIFFYGAGCRPEQTDRMASLLTPLLTPGAPTDRVLVASDLLGAARALCGDEAGVVAILGTGSGSAVYDGGGFVAQTPSLGFILGDEGSGAVLGRRLVSDVFKGQLSEATTEAFMTECGVTVNNVIASVYRETSPNRYLAQFTHFLSRHRDAEDIHALIVNEFHDFFLRNLRIYNRPDLSVGFVGSIAAVFEAELRKAANETGFTVGKILRSPAESLAEYHLSRLCNSNPSL